MEIEEILRELEFSTGRFPREALEAAIAQREAVTPRLLHFIEHACEKAEHLDDNAEETGYYDGHVHAMYLLAQFRETAGYPLIVKFFSIPGDFPVNSTGDVVTQDLDSLLASVCGGDMGPIKGMVENPALSEWVRGAALRSFLCLVAAGEMPREEAVAYYAELFRGRLERRPSNAWDSLVAGSADLCADELREEIEKAFDEHLVEPHFIRCEDVEKDFARGKERVREHLKERRYGLIESAIQKMEWWACFHEESATAGEGEAAAPLPPLLDEEDTEDEAAYPWEKEPVSPVRVEQKPGRNDPCPCGSGKKYKRCCGGRAEREA